MRIAPRQRQPYLILQRRGATVVEASLVFLLMFVLVFGMIDLGVVVLRHNLLSEAARQGARQSIVHGRKAPKDWEGGPWGPAKVEIDAFSTSHPIAEHIRRVLVRMDLKKTQIVVEWIDGSNDIEKRVRVTVSTSYQPMITFLFPKAITLKASATMPIAH